MKDATGELSMTAVAVVAIAGIALIFNQLILPTIKNNIKASTYCAQSYGCTNCDGQKCDCFYDTEETEGETVRCPDPGE